MKNNWFKLVILVFILLFAGGYFYWYEWRSMVARKGCMAQLDQYVKDKNLQRDVGDIASAELFYDSCLARQGIRE